MAAQRREINGNRNIREEAAGAGTVARYDLDIVEIQNSIIADLAELNKLLLEELENYRTIEDEDKHVLMMLEDIEEGQKDLLRLSEP